MMTRIFQKTNFLVLGMSLTLLVFSIGTNQAFSAEKGAYDKKIYAGSICRDADENSLAHQAAYTIEGYVANSHSSQTMGVVCPLIRDNQLTDQGIAAIAIYYTDNHPAKDISCAVVAKRLNGFSWRTSPQMKSQGTGANVFWQSRPVTTRGADSYFFLKCSLPPHENDGNPSIIKSILVTEAK